jgi:hypothetical protein
VRTQGGVCDSTVSIQMGAWNQRLVFFSGLFVAWLLIGLVLYVVFVSRTDHTDFFPRWVGARIALFKSKDPYSEASTHEIQRTIYGHLRQDGEDPQSFSYPAHVIPLLFPFWLLPMRISSALWSSLSVLMMVALVYTLGRAAIRQLFGVCISVFAIAHVLLVVFQGQFTLFVTACLGIAYWLYSRSNDVAAGVLLVFATIKPELVLFPMMILIATAIWERRWNLLVAFSLVFFVAMAISFVIAGIWVPQWLGQVRAYPSVSRALWPVGVLYKHWPVAALAFLVLAFLALKVARWDRDLVFASVCVLDLVLIPQTLPYSLAVLLLPIVLVLMQHHVVLVPIITVTSWGVLLLSYSIQMALTPLAVWALVLSVRCGLPKR